MTECIDCDRAMRDCSCENVLRCSCGIPSEVCVCAGPSPREFTAEEWREALGRKDHLRKEFYRLSAEARQHDGELILLAQVGSRAYGTHGPDSDYDFKGVYIASNRRMFSLRGPVHTLSYNEPHDTTVYELGHFVKLAAAGNPTVLEILWADQYRSTPAGQLLRRRRSDFLSKRIATTYGGYSKSQMKKSTDKSKLHTLRLLACGHHALKHGEVMVNMNDTLVAKLRRDSQLPQDQFEWVANYDIRAMNLEAKTSTLPDHPDEDKLDDLVLRLRG